MSKFLYKKGVALLWSLVICSILLIITGTMVSYMVKENRMSINIEDSAQAYAYAKTGIDWGMAQDINTPNSAKFDFDASNPGTKYVKIDIDGTNKIIKSEGYHNGVRRVLEYEVTDDPWDEIIPNTPTPNGTNIGTNKESFELQFDFWAKPLTHFAFGLSDGTAGADNAIGYYSYYDPSVSKHDARIYYSNAGQLFQTKTSGVFPSDDTNITEPYYYRVNIKYLKNDSAIMKISKYVSSNTTEAQYDCVGSAFWDLSGRDFGDLNTLYVSSSGNNPIYPGNSTEGDGTSINIGSTYIDNIVIQKAVEVLNSNTVVVDVNSSPVIGGTVTISPTSPGNIYSIGTPIILTASPRSGYSFSSWSGDCSGTNPVTTITVKDPTSCTANFFNETFFPISVKELAKNMASWVGLNNILINDSNTADLTLNSESSYSNILIGFDRSVSKPKITIFAKSSSNDARAKIKVFTCTSNNDSDCSSTFSAEQSLVFTDSGLKAYPLNFINGTNSQYYKILFDSESNNGKTIKIDSIYISD